MQKKDSTTIILRQEESSFIEKNKQKSNKNNYNNNYINYFHDYTNFLAEELLRINSRWRDNILLTWPLFFSRHGIKEEVRKEIGEEKWREIDYVDWFSSFFF